jgi:hypothetical protein
MQILAMLTMLIDHLGIVLAPGNVWFRCVGRLAMPLYAFALVIGCSRTRSFRRYALRLAVIAVLSQIPYSHALMEPDEPFEFNVVFTLLVALAVLRLMDAVAGPAESASVAPAAPAAPAADRASGSGPRAGAEAGGSIARRTRGVRRFAVAVGIAAGGCLLLELLPFDYGAHLLLLVLIYRYAAGQAALALHFFLNLLYIALGYPEYQMFSLLSTLLVAFVPDMLHEADRRIRVPRRLWRAFYPAHLAALAVIRHFGA